MGKKKKRIAFSAIVIAVRSSLLLVGVQQKLGFLVPHEEERILCISKKKKRRKKKKQKKKERNSTELRRFSSSVLENRAEISVSVLSMKNNALPASRRRRSRSRSRRALEYPN